MEKFNIIKTNDGSNTIFQPEYNETYHSTFGAIQESKHIFIETGFLAAKKSELTIFELGFGTGLNAVLTFLEAKKQKKTLCYNTIELFPLSMEVVNRLNYCNLLPENCEQIFKKMHEINWNEKYKLSNFFQFQKFQEDFVNFQFAEKIDVFYFDAFSPQIQAELWTNDIFKKVYDNMNRNGILTTYSCKGSVKRGLKSVGFQVEKVPGPKGKREIIRAIKY